MRNRPVLQGMTDADAWAACVEYEDSVYTAAELFSEGEWDRMVADVCALYEEYYALEGCDEQTA